MGETEKITKKYKPNQDTGFLSRLDFYLSCLSYKVFRSVQMTGSLLRFSVVPRFPLAGQFRTKPKILHKKSLICERLWQPSLILFMPLKNADSTKSHGGICIKARCYGTGNRLHILHVLAGAGILFENMSQSHILKSGFLNFF